MSAAAQGMTIASMMLCGLAMGMAFDVYRVASHRYHVARWLLPALDVAYWAAATLAVFGILLAKNEGEVRMYVFLGLGIGVTGYFGLFSQWVIKLTGKLIDTVNSLIHFLWKLFNTLIWTPFLWIVRLLAKLLDILFVITAALLLWVGKLVFKPFAALTNWLWPKTLPIRRKFDPMVQAYGRIRNRLKEIRDLLRKKP
ncbi:spore cortex biosynthesis protein YabQ [Cohnella endophytica]|uniref:Spore cortex biosynthesis protein YabQ n=1 Tax=Cohnella endophytica TaxID=2419778 RepID=A0A494XAE4_9BACL|nr:spore cortex biosynthesis protein YabQ [Cohnella endophytica]RKP45416.1 spore cortex biosynthesis protein YabQ [Cohnella endophytica]